jgi:monoterpene epsilon-lactone hydrolase
MTNKLGSITVAIGLSTITIMLLSYLLSANLQPQLYFVQAQNSTNVSQNDTSKISIPTTISKKAQEMLKNMTMNLPPSFVTPAPDDLEGWKKLNQQLSSMPIYGSQLTVDSYKPNVTVTKLGNVNVLDVKPKDWKDNGKVLVYLHGGGYTFFSANSTLGAVAPVANTTGLRVISVDYTLAPLSKWNQTTSEVVSVIQALKDQGYSLNDIAMYGDSAGGGLVAGSVLKMRDGGIGIPAAIVLWSPWTDVTRSGDSHYTLKNADAFNASDSMLKNMADAYVNPSDQKNPYASPVYGNFSKGFPPTLIQGGTKEILLSDFIRLYQAIDQADIPVKLDIYEGMPHDFQIFLYNTTESNTSLSKMTNFLHHYLGY